MVSMFNGHKYGTFPHTVKTKREGGLNYCHYGYDLKTLKEELSTGTI